MTWSGAGIPVVSGVALSGAQAVVFKDQRYIVEHQMPGMEGGVVEDVGKTQPRLEIHGIAYGSGADQMFATLSGFIGHQTPIVLPSFNSGYYFINSGTTMRIERLQFIYQAGYAYPFYNYVVEGVFSGEGLVISTISGQSVLILASGYYPLTMNSGALNVNISGGSVNVSGNAVSVSGNAVNVSGNAVSVSGNAVNVSGSSVNADVSGNVVWPASWAYTFVQTTTTSGIQTITSGFTFFHSAIISQGSSGASLYFRDGVSGNTTGSTLIMVTATALGQSQLSIPSQLYFDVVVNSGLLFTWGTGLNSMVTLFYRQS